MVIKLWPLLKYTLRIGSGHGCLDKTKIGVFMNFYKKIGVLFCILIAGSVLDHVTKSAAFNSLPRNETYSYLFDTFRIQYSENSGAFLSMGESLPPAAGFILLTLLPALFLVILFIYIIFSKKINASLTIAFSLILAGGSNNIFDRIISGRRVIDFMNWGIGPYFRTGILNFADMYITAGFIMLVILVFIDERKKKR